MNKQEVIQKLAQETGESKAAAKRSVNAFVGIVTSALAAGSEVSLADLGVFSVNTTKARTGRNPSTGERIQIKSKNVVKFSPAKSLKDSVN